MEGQKNDKIEIFIKSIFFKFLVKNTAKIQKINQYLNKNDS